MFGIVLVFATLCFNNEAFGQSCSVCPNGWTTFETSCYMVGYGMNLSFIEAEHYCRQHNSHLVHVETDIENLFIVDILQKTQAGYSWLGLTDMDVEGIWEWYDTKTRAEYSHWSPGEPGGGNGQDCGVYAVHHSYSWDDYPCTAMFHPICEMTCLSKPPECPMSELLNAVGK